MAGEEGCSGVALPDCWRLCFPLLLSPLQAISSRRYVMTPIHPSFCTWCTRNDTHGQLSETQGVGGERGCGTAEGFRFASHAHTICISAVVPDIVLKAGTASVSEPFLLHCRRRYVLQVCKHNTSPHSKLLNYIQKSCEPPIPG